jgi:putative FmdB family regulatory protein
MTRRLFYAPIVSAKIKAESALLLRVLRVPLYEYQCKKCKNRFEKIQKFSDPPVKKCPQCGGPVEQLLHAPAVQFKGTGWYVTDYAAKQPAGGADKKEDKAAAPDKDKGHDTKPKKSEAKKTKE